MRACLIGWCILVAWGGCGRSKPTSPAPASERRALSANPGLTTSPVPAPERLVAIGDLHGDLTATLAALRLAGAIDASGAWAGGKLWVVQTGDQLDRGDDEPDILALLGRLQDQARATGGNLVVLNGNHELMNVGGDFRYVTTDGFADYDSAAHARSGQQQPSPAGRARAFAPGGAVARQLAQRPISARIAGSLFVHGGVLVRHIEYGLERIDREVAEWMQGRRPAPPPIVVGEDSPVWTRIYSDGTPSEAACTELGEVLQRAGVQRIVVGHTVQRGGITNACEGRVWRIDVGLAKAYGGPTQVLEIRAGQVRILKAP